MGAVSRFHYVKAEAPFYIKHVETQDTMLLRKVASGSRLETDMLTRLKKKVKQYF